MVGTLHQFFKKTIAHLKLQHLIPQLVTLDHKVKDLLMCLVVLLHLLQLPLMNFQQLFRVIFWEEKKKKFVQVFKIFVQHTSQLPNTSTMRIYVLWFCSPESAEWDQFEEIWFPAPHMHTKSSLQQWPVFWSSMAVKLKECASDTPVI